MLINYYFSECKLCFLALFDYYRQRINKWMYIHFITILNHIRKEPFLRDNITLIIYAWYYTEKRAEKQAIHVSRYGPSLVRQSWMLLRILSYIRHVWYCKPRVDCTVYFLWNLRAELGKTDPNISCQEYYYTFDTSDILNLLDCTVYLLWNLNIHRCILQEQRILVAKIIWVVSITNFPKDIGYLRI